MATPTPVTPRAGLAFEIVTGGTAVTVVPNVPNGGYITNPSSNIDQNISPSAAEILYVDPVASISSLVANGTTVALYPGQSFELIPGQISPVYCNAATSGHKFTVVYY
jgi:hypothetical protein